MGGSLLCSVFRCVWRVWQELRSNIHGVVQEGKDFILSCVARGATSMQFSWYKDGVLINASLSRR